MNQRGSWSGQQDSNLRPSGPKPDALPDCAIPRYWEVPCFISVFSHGTQGLKNIM
jgi:hypothetical protein